MSLWKMLWLIGAACFGLCAVKGCTADHPMQDDWETFRNIVLLYFGGWVGVIFCINMSEAAWRHCKRCRGSGRLFLKYRDVHCPDCGGTGRI